MGETTTIEISRENWRWLNEMKDPGDSFNDVLNRVRADTPQNLTPMVGPPDKLDLPGSGSKLEARRQALVKMYMHIQEEGSATKADLLKLVDPDDVGYSSTESFWANAIKGRDTLRVLPNIEAPNEGEHTWQYVK